MLYLPWQVISVRRVSVCGTRWKLLKNAEAGTRQEDQVFRQAHVEQVGRTLQKEH